MKNKVFEVIARTALISVGALLLFDAAFLMLFSNIHSGLFLTLAVGALLSLFGILYNGIYRKIPKFIKLIFYIGITAVALFMLFLLLYGSADTADYTEDALIVLGAGVNGEEPSQDLKNRLDRALEYYKKNPDAVFVLSGGKGPQEDITEALAMQRYLTERGVPEENILKEEKPPPTKISSFPQPCSMIISGGSIQLRLLQMIFICTERNPLHSSQVLRTQSIFIVLRSFIRFFRAVYENVSQ